MRRLPVLPTLIVGLACAAMIALGFWQLERLGQKEALLTLYRANLSKPEIALPALGPVAGETLFRRTEALCLSVISWRSEAGRTEKGVSGYRWIAECSTGAEGPGLIADMGTSSTVLKAPNWKGGPVGGLIATEPDHSSLFAGLLGKGNVLRPMIISDGAAPGLEPSAKPSPEDIPNNHLAYAVQWFLFAAIAALIYGLALRRRG